MYVFTQKGSSVLKATITLALTADERTRSRYRYRFSGGITDDGGGITDADPDHLHGDDGDEIYLELPRGTTLQDGDCLTGEGHPQVLKIVAKPEPVLTVRAATPSMAERSGLQLLQAAYHLGNRHVALELGADYLRLAPDPVLESMLHQLGLSVTAETAPFQPESGAYGHHH